MKIQINTETKIITLLEKCSFEEFDKIKEFIGENWKEWEIEAETKIVKDITWIPYKKDEFIPDINRPLIPNDPYILYNPNPLTPFWYTNDRPNTIMFDFNSNIEIKLNDIVNSIKN